MGEEGDFVVFSLPPTTMEPHSGPVEGCMGKDSGRSAAFPKLRTHARGNCEHAFVELGGIDSQKSVQDVRLSRSCPWIQGLVSDVYICVRLVVCHLCHRVCHAEDRREGPSR